MLKVSPIYVALKHFNLRHGCESDTFCMRCMQTVIDFAHIVGSIYKFSSQVFVIKIDQLEKRLEAQIRACFFERASFDLTEVDVVQLALDHLI